ncbi:hypothetical protein NM688_g6774 [Phlebia brevispora]|uniref:Uncharacterized protein n=1 Tax=Phlebia brevispora TaxID=194682 RepID=A0ACC1SCV5_9APHY|nr:hypothetical protein NM688_g6774 [Phlebia brevispora]
MTGADVPVELFDILLKYIGHEGDPDAKSGISMDKRELGLISLACRRWADSLRPHIFQMITLRSIKDAHTLLSFIRHSHSFIARYIEEVVLSQSLTPYPYSPWIHRTPVFAEIMGSLGFHGRLNVALCGPLPAGKFTKGVCEMLPTSVPSAFKGVECLELKDLHFKKLGDLVRIPRELPSLQGLKCSNVTWEETSSEELPPTIQYLSGKDRGGMVRTPWMHRRQGSGMNIDGNEWKGLGAYRQEDCLGSPASLACPWQVKVHFTDRVARQPRRVHAIELYFSSVEEKDLERPDWSAIDRLTVALPSLGTLLVCSQSPAHLLLFHKEVVMQKMPNLHGSHKLKYALRSRNWEGQHNIYTPVACSGDKVRTIGPPVDSIRELHVYLTHKTPKRPKRRTGSILCSVDHINASAVQAFCPAEEAPHPVQISDLNSVSRIRPDLKEWPFPATLCAHLSSMLRTVHVSYGTGPSAVTASGPRYRRGFRKLHYDSDYDNLQVIQTLESSVSIEVPRNWRLWHKWRPCVWDNNWDEWVEWQDPMDNRSFDEATAFPALKPNATIFHVGLPDYTRNQRGWYHVKPWPPRSPPTVANGHNWGATGADVPVELFDPFLECIWLEGDPDAKLGIPMNKRELGLISLVCRRWADNLRPHIFSRITLRSIKDAHTLLSFIHHPHSSIASYIHMVVLSQSLTPYPYLPWVHRTPVFNQVMGALKTESHWLAIALCGPAPAGKFTKGISEMLPRSIPWAFAGVAMLELKDLHFKKLGDLMQIPRELPSLWRFMCRNVTWGNTLSEELSPTSQYFSRWTNVEIHYTLRGCTDYRAAIWFAALLAPRLRDRLEENDAHQICRIASALWQNLDGSEQAKDFKAYRCDDHLGFRAPTGLVYVYFTDRVARQARRVRAIELYLTSIKEKDLERSDWSAIDRLTLALPSLRTVLVWDHFSDYLLHIPTSLPEFHNKIVIQKMPNIHGSHKLKYALQSRDREARRDVYTSVACSGNKVRVIGPGVYSRQELL